MGKTNLPEFALGVSGANEYYGTPRNPLNEKHKLIPGGSSSALAAKHFQVIALDKAFKTKWEQAQKDGATVGRRFNEPELLNACRLIETG